MRVLVIEDHDDIRETLRDLLLARGYQVDVANSGPEALTAGGCGGPRSVDGNDEHAENEAE